MKFKRIDRWYQVAHVFTAGKVMLKHSRSKNGATKPWAWAQFSVNIGRHRIEFSTTGLMHE